MKIYAFIVLTLFTVAGYSQGTINNYKYVIVPERFSFSKDDDQYGLNTVARQLLEDKGFTALMESQTLPPEVAANKCNALRAEVTQKKGLFVTNLTLLLKDCQGNVIFQSKEGKSREKEFLPAFNLALRDAFTSLDNVSYKYEGPVQGAAPMAMPVAAAPANIPATAPATAATPATPAPAPATPVATDASGVLYAQATANGYQLIDTTPKKVMTLLKTSMQGYFIADDSVSNGVVFQKNGDWYFEYYKDNQLVSRKLQIKF